MDTVSASGFREKLRNHDMSAKGMVTKEVWELLKKNGKIPEVIDSFRVAYENESGIFICDAKGRLLKYEFGKERKAIRKLVIPTGVKQIGSRSFLPI